MAEYSFQATGTVQPSTFVTLDATADSSVKASTSGDQPIGVTQEWSHQAPIPGATSEAAVSGQQVKIYMVGDICLMAAGSSGFTRGDFLKPGTDSLAYTASSGQYYGAIALSSAATGALGRVLVQNGKL